VAHTLSRTFFWAENVLWKEDLRGHRCIVFLGEKDAIINASKVAAYLQDRTETSGDGSVNAKGCHLLEAKSLLKVVWGPNLDHAQIFDTRAGRDRLKNEILREARQVR